MKYRNYICIGLATFLGAYFIPKCNSLNVTGPKEKIEYSQKDTDKECNFYVVVPKNGKSPIDVNPNCIVKSSRDLEKRIKREIKENKRVKKKKTSKHKQETYKRYDYNKELIKGYIIEEAREHSVDEYLALAITRAESNFNPLDLSDVGARGIAQFMPWTAQSHSLKVPDYGIEEIYKRGKWIKASKCRAGLEKNCINDPTIDERLDPRKSAHAQMLFLNDLIVYLKKNGVEPSVKNIAAAYNAGPRHKGIKNNKYLPKETIKFRERVYDYYLKYKN